MIPSTLNIFVTKVIMYLTEYCALFCLTHPLNVIIPWKLKPFAWLHTSIIIFIMHSNMHQNYIFSNILSISYAKSNYIQFNLCLAYGISREDMWFGNGTGFEWMQLSLCMSFVYLPVSACVLILVLYYTHGIENGLASNVQCYLTFYYWLFHSEA